MVGSPLGIVDMEGILLELGTWLGMLDMVGMLDVVGKEEGNEVSGGTTGNKVEFPLMEGIMVVLVSVPFVSVPLLKNVGQNVGAIVIFRSNILSSGVGVGAVVLAFVGAGVGAGVDAGAELALQ